MIALAAALVASLAITGPAVASEEPEDGPTIRGGTGDDPEARRIRGVAQDAAALVERGEHEAALTRIDDAEHERASPAFVFMRGAVEEERGRCPEAIDAYRKFLAMEVPDEDAEAARAGLRRCGAEPTPAEPDPEPSPAPAPRSTDHVVPPTQPADQAPPTKRWYRDPAGGVLAAVGVASLAVGGTLWGLSAREANQAREEDLLSEFDDRARGAERMQSAGIAMVAIGGAFAIAAAIRWGLLARRERSRASSRRVGTVALGVYMRF